MLAIQQHFQLQIGASKSISKRLSISFLNARNRDFGEKLLSNSLSKCLNIAIFYSEFFASVCMWVSMNSPTASRQGEDEPSPPPRPLSLFLPLFFRRRRVAVTVSQRASTSHQFLIPASPPSHPLFSRPTLL